MDSRTGSDAMGREQNLAPARKPPKVNSAVKPVV